MAISVRSTLLEAIEALPAQATWEEAFRAVVDTMAADQRASRPAEPTVGVVREPLMEYVVATKRSTGGERSFLVIVERDDDGYYVGSAPALRGCHTQGRTLDALMSNMREAIELSLEGPHEPLPPMQFIGVQQLQVAG